MLSIKAGGSWEATEPSSVAQMILDGSADQFTPSKDPSLFETEGPLNKFLRHSHFEALSDQMLGRLRAMYTSSTEAVEPSRLLARVEELCKWSWTDQVIKGRLLWVAGWLAELTGSFDKAIGYYGAYLRHPTQESHLRLLAHNNRGVLRICLGQAEAVVEDLGRAAILMDRDVEESQQLTRLPAACFNLLNLINVAFDSDILRDPVERALVDFMQELPQSVRDKWLGPDREKKDGKKGESQSKVLAEASVSVEVSAATSDQIGEGQPEEEKEDQEAGSRNRLSILLDHSFERLNQLTLSLLTEAKNIAPVSGDIKKCADDELNLWHVRPETDVAGDLTQFERRGQDRVTRYKSYAEAASLLYAHDIPSSLSQQQDTIFWALQFAQEALGRSEEYVSTEAYDSARQTLEQVQKALDGLKADPRIESMFKEVEHQLEMVVNRQRACEQLEYHQAYVDMVWEVKNFCDIKDLCKASRQAVDLQRDLQELKARFQAKRQLWGEEAVPVFEDLPEQVTGHLRDLERSGVEGKLEKPRQQLREQWPDSWSKPVPQSVYEVLAQCRLHDPKCLVKDWDLLRSQLDSHQAQYYFQSVIRGISGGHLDRKQAEAVLVLALSLDPSLGSAAAPIFALFNLPETVRMPEDLGEIRTKLLDTASRFLREQPLGPDGVWSPAVRVDLVREACLLLKRLVHAFHGVGGEATKLWRGLEKSFSPALNEGRPEVVDEIEQMIEACLDGCPQYAAGIAARSDPRNPLRILLEACYRASLIGKGEQALNARRPDRETAMKHFTQAIQLGLEDAGQLRRAVVGFYLAQYGNEDPQHLQREILDRLGKWLAEGKGKRQGNHIRFEDVLERITEARQQVGLTTESRPHNRDFADAGADNGTEKGQDSQSESRDGQQEDY